METLVIIWLAVVAVIASTLVGKQGLGMALMIGILFVPIGLWMMACFFYELFKKK